MRVGTGFDIHRLEPGIPFFLGGIRIPSEKGPSGHSDGDPLLHALTDALLGALSLGDIGGHFPDTDPRYKGKESAFFLREVARMAAERGWTIANMDATILLERPKLAPHILPMRENIARLLGLELDQVSMKAKTHEKLDAIGREEGVAVHAVVLLESGGTNRRPPKPSERRPPPSP